jgi:hypothetical protein
VARLVNGSVLIKHGMLVQIQPGAPNVLSKNLFIYRNTVFHSKWRYLQPSIISPQSRGKFFRGFTSWLAIYSDFFGLASPTCLLC